MKRKEDKNKTVLKGMNLEQILKWCANLNQSSFRANQIYQWMYKHGVSSADSMNNISKELRYIINEQCTLSTLTIEKVGLLTTSLTPKCKDNAFINVVLPTPISP